MIRLLLILFLCIALFDTSYGQKPKGKRSKPIIITKTIDSNGNPLKDTAFLNELARVYGDNNLAIVDSLLKDTAFLKSIGDKSLPGYGEFASSQYKVHLPIEALGWTSDYEHIFQPAKYQNLIQLSANLKKKQQMKLLL